MRYDAEHKERTRLRVLSEAAAAIRRHGPEGVSVADVMDKAGLTHGGFYAHFKSKDVLVAESITAMFDERYALFMRCIEGREPAKGLAKFIDVYLDVRHRDAVAHGCPIPSLSGDLARLPEPARKRFEAGLERLTDALAGLLRDAGTVEGDGAVVAASMMAEMAGAVALSRAVSSPERSQAILKATREAVRKRVGL